MSNGVNTLPDVRQTVEVNATIQKVWNAVSTAEGIAAWFMAPSSDFKPEVGCEFHLEAGQFGQSPCKVTEVDPPNRLVFNWGRDWTLTFELKELDGGKTEFTLIHGGWDADKVTEFGQAHPQVREHMAGGWVGIMKKFVSVVEA
ncbi:SRPBCC family protein [Paenibacillus glycanilyticus]|uniref:Activator of Hsp90 ATPase homologue 1/2-like C-terminal domain-containing protein n=1 Tax=Paenibacillus glycanilyticus TaxID=126569 RepID=A0ABQ6GCW8_9BACL|nr:SRPBCC domain-containing protein [Paenibacillus glycanilyticus]GLX68806.1 hypothetical protein MU1_31510 [Paenibacillus glycanilyticus]